MENAIDQKILVKIASALAAGTTYKLASTSKGRAAALAGLMAQGKPLAPLVTGWSEEKFAASIAAFAHLACSKGASVEALASALQELGACNSSAAMKAASGLTLEIEGFKEKPSLELIWGKSAAKAESVRSLAASLI